MPGAGAVRTCEVIRTIYFDRFRQSDWPPPHALAPFFLAPAGQQWSFLGGNDSWGINVSGLDGTSRLPEAEQVRVSLAMIGNRQWGVYLAYKKWDGRTRALYNYSSKGDLGRIGQFTESLHETRLPIGLFVPFPRAWEAVKQFMETDGALPDKIAWVAAGDLPAGTFAEPK